MIFKTIKLLLIALSALLLSLVLALSFSPSSQWLLTQLSNVVDGLTIRQPQGNLYQGIQIEQLTWQQAGLAVELNQLTLIFDWVCISRTQVCIDTLSADAVKVTLNSKAMAVASVPNDEAATVSSEPWMPAVPLLLQQLRVADAQLTIDGFNVALQNLDLKADWQQEVIRVERLLVAQWALQMPPSQVTAVPVKQATPAMPDSLTLELPDISMPYQIVVQQLSLNQGRFNDGLSDYLFPELSTSATVNVADLDIERFHLVSPWGELNLSGRQGFQASYPSQLNGRWQMHLEQQPLTLDFSLKGDGSHLVAELQSHGWLVADLHLNGAWQTPNIPFNISAELQQPFSLIPQQLRLNRFSLQAQGAFNHYSLAWQSELSGLQDLWLNGELSGDLAHIKQFSMVGELLKATPQTSASKPSPVADHKTLGGFQLQGSAAWQPKLQAELKLKVERLALNHWLAFSDEFSLPQLDGLLTAQLTEQHWQIEQAEFHGEWLGLPLLASLTGDGDLQTDASQASLKLNLGSSQWLARASLADQRLILNSSIKAPMLAELPWLSDGSLDLRFAAKGPMTEPLLDWSLQAEQVVGKQFELASLASAGKLRVDPSLTGQLQLNVAKLLLGEQGIDAGTLEYSSHNSQQRLAFKAAQTSRQYEFLLQGRGNLNQWQGKISQASLQTELGRWSLARAIDLKVVAQRATIGAHCWVNQASQLCLNAPLRSDGNSQLDLTVKQFDLASLSPLMPDDLALQGTASLQLDAQLKQWHPERAQLKLALSPGRLNQQTHSEPLSLNYQKFDLEAKLLAKRVHWQALFESEQLGTMSSLGNASIARNGTVDARLSLGQLKLSPLLPFVDALDHLSGEINGSVSLSGKLSKPKLQGEVNLVDGVLSGPDIPLTVEQLQSRLQFNNQVAYLSGRFNSDGRVANWQGQFSWPKGELEGAIDVNAEKLPIHVDPYARLVVSPEIRVAIGDRLLAVSGTIAVDQGEIEVKSLPESAVTESSDAIVIEEQSDKGTTQHTALAIEVTLSDKISLQALGLDTHLRGQLKLNQQPSAPLLTNGRIELVDGRFMAYGQNLIIKKGWLMFTGPLDQPYLDIQAVRNPDTIADDVVVGVKVLGLADAPQVTLYSEPSMSQNEMLSYLLRGRALGDNEQDSNALTAMLLSAGVNRAGGLVGNVGDSLGIKDLSLGTAGSGSSTQVEVSAYILPGVQVRYGMGVFDPVNELTVKYEVLPKLFIEAFSGLNSALDIYYEFYLE